MHDRDPIFEMTTSSLRCGPGATHEVGADCAALGAQRALVVTDPRLAQLPPVAHVRESLRSAGVPHELFDQVRVEPTDRSLQAAIEAARRVQFDVLVAVGGGSVIDTAKAINLYVSHPADFLTYVNAPLGAGRPIPGPLRPLLAIPTTAGTGSETTGVAIFDLSDLRAKTGIADRRLRPTLGIIDAENTRTQPPLVAASAGLDVLCHAIESYTARPYDERPRPARPLERPAYQGANPISDVWAAHAAQLAAAWLPRAVADPSDDAARRQMLLAASYAGMGFGNAGVHLCHGLSYAISGMVRDYRPRDYPDDHPLVPHGISVVLSAPAVFRFTAPAHPGRHLQAAAWLGAEVGNATDSAAGELLAQQWLRLIRSLGLPNGLAGLGYTPADIPALARATLPQHRVTKLAPRVAELADLERLLEESLQLW